MAADIILKPGVFIHRRYERVVLLSPSKPACLPAGIVGRPFRSPFDGLSMTALIGLVYVRLPFFLAYFVEDLVHALDVIAGIIHKKFKLWDNAHLVLYAGAQFVAYFGSMRFDGVQCQLAIGIIEKAQEYPRDGQVGCNTHLGDGNERIGQQVDTLALKYGRKVLLYYSCKFLLTS